MAFTYYDQQVKEAAQDVIRTMQVKPFCEFALLSRFQTLDARVTVYGSRRLLSPKVKRHMSAFRNELKRFLVYVFDSTALEGK